MSGSTRDLIEKIPKLKKQICNLTSELEDLVYIQAINSLNISGTNLEITFLNQDGLLQTLSQDLFTIQESEIQDNVLNYTALNSIVNPDLYQFAYVRESQGIKFISYKGSGLYMWNGTKWIEDDTDVFNQLQILIDNLNLEIQQRIDADSLLRDRIEVLENIELLELVDSNDLYIGTIRK